MSARDSVAVWARRWWRGEASGGAAATLLLTPAEGAYRGVVAARNALYDRGVLQARHATVPVISVGNLTVGGTGKTPIAAWLAARLRDRGRAPAIVLRGYGDDEIRLHREVNPSVPVVAGRRRLDAVAEAVDRGADCVVLDDGFQHRPLARDLDLVLVAAEGWRGSRRMLPVGPYREGFSALRRADLVLVTRKTASREDAEAVARELEGECGAVVGVAHLAPAALAPLGGEGPGEELAWLAGRAVLAVTSMAEPERFRRQLEAQGAAVTSLDHPDHYPFPDRAVRELERRAAGRAVVVSRKEAVKLRGRVAPGVDVFVLEQSVEVEVGREELDQALDRALAEER